MDNENFNSTMAKLNITWNGMNGDLVDPIPFDLTNEEVFNIASESVTNGNVPGIDASSDVDFTDFVVDRYSSTEDVPFSRIVVRPKTPFGE